MEKYTVIIPTRDRAETLEATLRTCLRQTYENFEIIVSDNCSGDNTKEIVDGLHDPRIRYINPGRRLS
ncbi:MAG: glycosyltransferase family 2 protein, partial [Methylobacter sp.]